MADPIGENVVTAIARRWILPEVTDNIYNSNVLFFRLNRANKRIVRGGTQIEVPLMYARFNAGGSYRGWESLNVVPSDTIKNAAYDWKQYYVPVSVDGLTLIKTDSPQAIANFISLYFQQAEMEMAENLATGLYSDGTNDKDIDGLEAQVDDGGVAAINGGIPRANNAWWNAQDDSTSTTLTLPVLQSMHGSTKKGGKSATIILSRQEQYNRYWNMNVVNQDFPTQPGGHDVQLASAGFDNLLFNGTPWVVDDKMFDGPSSSNSAILMLNEDFMFWAVSPRADFYVEPFQTPIGQDAMVSKMLWAGNLIFTNCARHGKLTNISA